MTGRLRRVVVLTPARTVTVATAAVLVAVALAAAPAEAHVTVRSPEAVPGGYAKLAFRVPNERDASGTVQVAVRFPAEHPIPSVSVRPTPGWKATVERIRLERPLAGHGAATTEVVSVITWDGGVIHPGEFQEFELAVGPLPTGVDRLVFPATQTYASGETVRWIEPPAVDGDEPDHPAPVLHLTGPEPDPGHVAAGMVDAAAPAARERGGFDWSMAVLLAVLVVAVVAGLARAERPRPAARAR